MRHRATTRYKNGGKHRGKTINQREIDRRIAQSFGFKHSLPQLDQPNQTGVTEFVTEPVNRGEAVETKTIQL